MMPLVRVADFPHPGDAAMALERIEARPKNARLRTEGRRILIAKE